MLYGASGEAILERAQVMVDPAYLKMVAVLAETSQQFDLGLHCSRCKQNLRGVNGHGDKRWVMECACRTFTGKNPFLAAP